MGFYTNTPAAQPQFTDRRDYVRECRRLAASGVLVRHCAARWRNLPKFRGNAQKFSRIN